MCVCVCVCVCVRACVCVLLHLGHVQLLQILMTNVFYNKWALYQSAERDCIIVSVDGRGTGYRGDK